MNILKKNITVAKTSELLQTIASPARLEILLAINTGEACVCHLEAILGYRQAYISQHLMALRKADIIESRREGRYIYHRLRKPELLDVIQQTASLTNFASLTLPILSEDCGCPKCIS